jgi:hypothetical protein
MHRRAARIIARAPKMPLLGALITSGVGLTGALLALVGYESALAMFGGAIVATLVWIALHRRQEKLEEDELLAASDNDNGCFTARNGRTR